MLGTVRVVCAQQFRTLDKKQESSSTQAFHSAFLDSSVNFGLSFLLLVFVVGILSCTLVLLLLLMLLMMMIMMMMMMMIMSTR